jgi:hypothetical protein
VEWVRLCMSMSVWHVSVTSYLACMSVCVLFASVIVQCVHLSVGLYVHMCGCVHTSGRRAFLGPKGMSCGRWPICPLTHMSIPQQAPGEESEVGPFISSPPSLLLKSSAN